MKEAVASGVIVPAKASRVRNVVCMVYYAFVCVFVFMPGRKLLLDATRRQLVWLPRRYTKRDVDCRGIGTSWKRD